MPQRTITNPQGAFIGVTDYRTGKDSAGDPIAAVQTVIDDFVAAGTILKGDLVNLVPPTSATVNCQWKQEAAAAADPIARQRGIALNAAVAGGQVKVCVYGLCLSNVGAAGAPAVDLAAIRGALAGLTLQSAVPDATTITGTVFGTFFGAKDANNQAWLFVNQW